MNRLVSMIPLAGALFVAGPVSASEPPQLKPHYSLWGLDLCFGDPPAGTDCDVRLEPPPTPAAATAEKTYAGVFRVFDKRVCLGAVDPAQDCWIRVAAPDDDAQGRGS